MNALIANPSCSDARCVEGSSVNDIKLVLRSSKPYYRQLTLLASTSKQNQKLLDVTLDVRNKYVVLAAGEFELCCLHPKQNFISIRETIFKVSDDEVRQIRESFPTLRVRV